MSNVVERTQVSHSGNQKNDADDSDMIYGDKIVVMNYEEDPGQNTE